MFKNQLISIFLLMLYGISSSNASSYGQYDLTHLLTVSEINSNKKYSFNQAYYDQIQDDLSAHAKDYPVQFDSPQDKQRAIYDVIALSKMLDVLTQSPNPDSSLLLQAAHLNFIGHNLDIPNAANKANALFTRLLQKQPNNPQANYFYGIFLASAAQPNAAIPFLVKAYDLGQLDAAYPLGLSYLVIGNKKLALKHLEDYQAKHPTDDKVINVIKAIKAGKITLNENKN